MWSPGCEDVLRSCWLFVNGFYRQWRVKYGFFFFFQNGKYFLFFKIFSPGEFFLFFDKKDVKLDRQIFNLFFCFLPSQLLSDFHLGEKKFRKLLTNMYRPLHPQQSFACKVVPIRGRRKTRWRILKQEEMLKWKVKKKKKRR